jgi:hypothetical protein
MTLREVARAYREDDLLVFASSIAFHVSSPAFTNLEYQDS